MSFQNYTTSYGKIIPEKVLINICLFLSPVAGRLKGQPVFRNTYPGLGQPKTQEENTIHWYKKREKEV